MNKKLNINQSEIAKFTQIANEWWDVNGKFKPLHQINPLRIEFIKQQICQHFKVEKLLNLKDIKAIDVGCGGGLATIPLKQQGLDICGLDAGEENIKIAEAQALKLELDLCFSHGSIRKLVEQGQKYNIVICLEVIEHVEDLAEFINDLTQLVSKDGLLIISTINRNVKSFMMAKLLAEYILNWVPRNTHQYSKFVKPSELNKLLEQKDFNIKFMQGFEFNPIFQQWSLTNNIDVNYIFSAKKP